MGRLENKVAFITGATGGIGEATAKAYLDEGAKVMLVGRSEAKINGTLDRLSGGENVAHYLADATDEEATQAAFKATEEAFGGVDIVFANAGTEGNVKGFADLSVAEFEAVINTNVTGVWLTIKHAVEPLKKRGGGSIIATSSIAGVIGFPGLAPYIASKHAVIGLVKTAALELGEVGIRINAIAPGPIENRMTESLVAQLSPDDPSASKSLIIDALAIKRFGTNEEVANLALFLGSDESSYSTGSVFFVDGGFTAA